MLIQNENCETFSRYSTLLTFVVEIMLPASKLQIGRSSASTASTSTKAVATPISSPAPGPAQTIVFVSAEVAPFSKTGGLGDVLLGLPKELAGRGHRVITIAPR